MYVPRSVLIWKSCQECLVGPPRVLGLRTEGAPDALCRTLDILAWLPRLLQPPVKPSWPASWPEEGSGSSSLFCFLSAGRRLSVPSIAPALSTSAAEVSTSWAQTVRVRPVGSKVLAQEPSWPGAWTTTRSLHGAQRTAPPRCVCARHRRSLVLLAGLSLGLADVNTYHCTPGFSALRAHRRRAGRHL